MEAMPETGIYWGRIAHNRFSPKRHSFTYPIFIFSMDLDETAGWDRKLLLFGHNRFSLYSLRDGDHLNETGLPVRSGGTDAPAQGIKAGVLALLRERGFRGSVDKVFMVTQLRILGYLFNPVTFYYCYSQGRPVAYVAEVNNTFHQRHCYAFFGPGAGAEAEFTAEKVFYVSPFLEMGMTYRFRFEALGGRLGVFIDDYRDGKPVLKTRITGEWSPMGDWPLLGSFLRIPFMTVWIIAWIHWQALKLWLKKVPLAFRPHDGMKPGYLRPAGASKGSEPW
ncbi:MAG: hypothetical protein JWP91_4235 [Fibrobacteres bacterium]|nr:hypothetical protein [Fibrobacterota bacterium]